jgi:transcriptional repressor OPI1
VLSPGFQESSLSSDSRSLTAGRESPNSVRSLPRIDPGPQYDLSEPRGLEAAVASPSEGGSAMSVDSASVRSPSVSMDDPDVRAAAEALSGLGNPGIPTHISLAILD